jgi:hypothetical protein
MLLDKGPQVTQNVKERRHESAWERGSRGGFQIGAL